MSYQFTPDNYNENYRPLDLAALVYLYGINPNYKSSNDIYSFNSSEGFIIIDGGGIDSIDASKHDKHLYIDRDLDRDRDRARGRDRDRGRYRESVDILAQGGD